MDAVTQKEQVATAERLQTLWLNRMEEMLKAKSITSSDLATLERFFRTNGWSVDPAKLPQELRNTITDGLDPKAFDEDDPDVLARIA